MEPMSSELLTLLSSLLQSKENKIVPYAARLLYILMASDKFHKEANSMDIGKVLDGSIKVFIIYCLVVVFLVLDPEVAILNGSAAVVRNIDK